MKPIKKELQYTDKYELCHIKNNYIDTILTMNYELPALLHTENINDEFAKMLPVSEIQKS